MRLRKLNEGAWTVAAPLEDDNSCEVLNALQILFDDPRTKGVAAGFVAFWEQIDIQGPRRLGTDIYHCVDDKNEIYEFIKGSHRLLCFVSEGRLVICSHIFRKKSQKTPKSETKKAIALRKKYLEAHAAQAVLLVD